MGAEARAPTNAPGAGAPAPVVRAALLGLPGAPVLGLSRLPAECGKEHPAAKYSSLGRPPHSHAPPSPWRGRPAGWQDPGGRESGPGGGHAGPGRCREERTHDPPAPACSLLLHWSLAHWVRHALDLSLRHTVGEGAESMCAPPLPDPQPSNFRLHRHPALLLQEAFPPPGRARLPLRPGLSLTHPQLLTQTICQ